MTRFYKKIEVKNLGLLQKSLLSIAPVEMFKNPRIFFPEEQDKFYKIPELCELLDGFNMQYKNTLIGYYFYRSGIPGPVHVDWGSPEYSINIPIKSCNNTFTNFYDTDGEPELIPERIEDGVKHTPHYSFKKVKCNVVEKFESNIPCIMYIKKPHNVTNNTGNIRINLLIRNSDNELMSSIFSSLAS
jgi:hypothetical protein